MSGGCNRSRILGLVWAVGCGTAADPPHTGTPDTETTPTTPLAPGERVVVDAGSWVAQSATDDPFATERPADVDCPEWGYFEEDGVLEINTDICDYAAIEQPLLAPVYATDVLRVDWWHAPLFSDPPSEAHIAIGLGDEVLWETTLPVPADAHVEGLELPVSTDHDTGEPAWIHLHNHGSNTYNFVNFVARPAD